MTESMPGCDDNGARLSVVMGTLNEEEAIGKVVKDLRSLYPEAEIVIVDSSSDKTAEIAESLGCLVIKQIPPRGYSMAFHTGFRAASRPIVITMDCDGTYPVKAIAQLLTKIDAGYDLVSGSRLGRLPQTMPLPNYLANKLFVITAAFLCGVKSTDLHSGMRAYRSSMLRELHYDPENTLAVEAQVSAFCLGYKCTEIFIDYNERVGGESKLNPIKGTIGTFQVLWNWRRYFNRLRRPIGNGKA
jgi:glycosyltransferase involved in cell wall biosynthesis